MFDLCLATGARWSESETITAQQVATDRVTYENTKGKRVRTVQIAPELADRLRGLVPLAPNGTKIGALRRVLEKCSFSLPRGQASHALRHTFSSHYIMNGGNILSLQRILGHSSVNMTMRYAHLAPDFTAEAVRLNPLGQLLDGKKQHII